MKAVRRLTVIVLSTLSLCYLAACAILYFAQGSLLYHPTNEAAVPESAKISLEIDGETLRILVRPADGPKALIYFGGNADDVSFNLYGFADSIPQTNLYLVNYRGYGGSTGSPSEQALYSDALAVYDFARTRHASISVLGRSLGSGVATYLAANREIEKLVLVTPFDSIVSVAKHQFPIFPVSLLLIDKFDSASRVKEVRASTLVLIAQNDSVIPRRNSESLIAHFPSNQIVVREIPGTSHDSIGVSSEARNAIASFLE